jgi:2,4-dienoyl-CoA reductase-like NADH-dependent reductase (Old Yellow Enzyme family)
LCDCCLLRTARCHYRSYFPFSLTQANFVYYIVCLRFLLTHAAFPAGFGWHNAPGIYDDVMCAAWKDIVDAVHAKGSVIYLQLWHMGRQVYCRFLQTPFLHGPFSSI